MKTKLIELGAALGGHFEQRGEAYNGCILGYIALDNGMKIWVDVNGYGKKGRIQFSPAYPNHETKGGSSVATIQRDFCGYGEPTFSGITVSAEKSVDQIAKDVRGRFLTVYRPLHEKAVAWCDAQTEYHAGVRSMTQAADHHFSTVSNSSKSRVYVRPGYIGKDCADVTVYNLTASDMARLAEFIRTL